MKNDEIGLKPYLEELSFFEARLLFKYKTKMVDAKRNFKNKKEYEITNWLCDSCESKIDSNSHIIWCESYRELREGKDLQCEKDLVYCL